MAALPGGGTWPITDVRFGQWVGRRRVRRIAAGLLVAAGVLDIASVFIRQLRDLGIVDGCCRSRSIPSPASARC